MFQFFQNISYLIFHFKVLKKFFFFFYRFFMNPANYGILVRRANSGEQTKNRVGQIFQNMTILYSFQTFVIKKIFFSNRSSVLGYLVMVLYDIKGFINKSYHDLTQTKVGFYQKPGVLRLPQANQDYKNKISKQYFIS